MTPPPSPCTSCVSEDTCPCDAYLLWDELAHTPRECLYCADVEWLRLSGEEFDTICARLGKSRHAVLKHLNRHGRSDLAPKPIIGVRKQAAAALRAVLGGSLEALPGVPGHLLPTPAVNDMGEGKTPADWDQWTERMRAAHGNGNGHGKSLAIEALRLGDA